VQDGGLTILMQHHEVLVRKDYREAVEDALRIDIGESENVSSTGRE